MVPLPPPHLEESRRQRRLKRLAVRIAIATISFVLLTGTVFTLARYGPTIAGNGEADRPASAIPGTGGTAVDRAIAKGVLYLKGQQRANGTWGETHSVGLAALAAFALLESGVPSDDPYIRRSLQFVREGVANLDKTYELALAVLFLDRLKQPQDDERIRLMVLRLTAGQTEGGGWSYLCPILPAEQGRDLLVALQRTSPARPAALFVQGADGRSLSRHFEPSPPPTSPTIQQANPPGTDLRAIAQAAVMTLPETRRKLPGLQISDKPPILSDDDESDNSNTQFAALALWAARRRGVPVERALARVVSRFRNSQKPTGGWGYLYQNSEAAAASWDTTTPSMTGAGLICLAVGWGLADTGTLSAEGAESLSDPGIRQGLDALGKCVGYPGGRPAKAGEVEPPLDLYYLWTLERVGVLYDVRVLDGKDWWVWGCGQILDSQGRDGRWNTGGYRGATPVTDTSFALLFLKRTDLSFGLSGQIKQMRLVKASD